MKKFFKEFKEFISKGSVLDLAVGVIIGGAFSTIVTALTDKIIQPLINSIGGAEIAGVIKLPWVDYSGLEAEQIQTLVINYGAFITAVINFIIMAFVIFLIVKAVNKAKDLASKKKEEAEAAPTTKVCPFCKSEIAIDATKCPHCTADIPADAQ